MVKPWPIPLFLELFRSLFLRNLFKHILLLCLGRILTLLILRMIHMEIPQESLKSMLR